MNETVRRFGRELFLTRLDHLHKLVKSNSDYFYRDGHRPIKFHGLFS